MKKTGFLAIICSLFITSIYAYNPPANGEFLYELSSPRLLVNSSSTCGGGIFYVSPDSIVANPALTSDEQLVKLNLGYTALVSFNPAESHHFGSAIQTGVIIPTNYTVFTAYLNGTFSSFDTMNLGNSLNLKTGVSKEVTEHISLGINLNTGVFWGAGADWSLSTDLGLLYEIERFGFMKDFRIGLSIMNLGKNYSKTTLANPINGEKPVGLFPTVCTVKGGLAGLFVSTDNVKFGFNLDVATPLVQNVIVDGGLQLGIKDVVFISVSDRFNMAEFVNARHNYMPSIGIGFKFSIDMSNNEYLSSKGWEEIDSNAAVAYKSLYGDIHAVSGGVDVSLGKRDVTPPVIQIFIDEGDDE